MRCSQGTVAAPPTFRSSIRRATSSSQALLDRLIRSLKTIEQRISQCSALVNGERECPFQEIGNLWTHGHLFTPAMD